MESSVSNESISTEDGEFGCAGCANPVTSDALVAKLLFQAKTIAQLHYIQAVARVYFHRFLSNLVYHIQGLASCKWASGGILSHDDQPLRMHLGFRSNDQMSTIHLAQTWDVRCSGTDNGNMQRIVLHGNVDSGKPESASSPNGKTCKAREL